MISDATGTLMTRQMLFRSDFMRRLTSAFAFCQYDRGEELYQLYQADTGTAQPQSQHSANVRYVPRPANNSTKRKFKSATCTCVKLVHVVALLPRSYFLQ